jgi:hypothetical protein
MSDDFKSFAEVNPAWASMDWDKLLIAVSEWGSTKDNDQKVNQVFLLTVKSITTEKVVSVAAKAQLIESLSNRAPELMAKIDQSLDAAKEQVNKDIAQDQKKVKLNKDNSRNAVNKNFGKIEHFEIYVFRNL